MTKTTRLKCPHCSMDVSVFRIQAHMRSPACLAFRLECEAEEALRRVGGYVGYVQGASMRLIPTFGRRRVHVRAVGVDDLGHATIVDQKGCVRQYLYGEWEFADNSARYLRA